MENAAFAFNEIIDRIYALQRQPSCHRGTHFVLHCKRVHARKPRSANDYRESGASLKEFGSHCLVRCTNGRQAGKLNE